MCVSRAVGTAPRDTADSPPQIPALICPDRGEQRSDESRPCRTHLPGVKGNVGWLHQRE